jgi:predicted ribosome quality control (RQC) complex YloA/Tae2 family protein
MIPAAPEALLVRPHTTASAWPVIVRSRINLGNTLDAQNFTIPTGSNAPIDPPLRDEHKTLSSYTGRVESYLNEEAFLLRKATAQKILKDLLKQAKLRVTQATTAKREAESDQDWNRLGTLLKATLHDPAPLLREGKLAFRVVHDYETEQEVKIPADPRLEASAQVEKYFQLAKRRARRIQEATERAQNFSETVARIESDLVIPLADLDWTALERLERAAGITPPDGTRVPLAASKEKKRARSWLGRTFFSKDGSPLWIGRNKDENLELTFKHAKGNDIWLHVRGKPGAHGVVPLSPGKSASLETLIDAAMLVIYYSNGENWGKTEVDYTFKKYVKRIKDSTEASYTHNKTLLITPDPARLEKLLKI